MLSAKVKTVDDNQYLYIYMSTETEIIKDVKTETANEDRKEVVQMSEGYSPAYGTCSLSSNNVLPTEQKHKGSLSYMQDEKIFQVKNIIINLQNK